MTTTLSARDGRSPVAPPSRMAWKLRRSALRVALSSQSIDFDNFFQNDTVAVFPALDVVLNRIKKAGNTSLVAFLDDLDRAHGGSGPDPKSTKEVKARRRPHFVPFTAIPRMRSFKTLVTVRNPYHRVISGFLDKIAGGTDPMHAGYPCYGDASISAFETFLQHCMDRDFFGNRHFMPQSKLLILPVEKFTKVARLESLVADVDAFLTALGHRPGTASPLATPHPLEMRDDNKIHGSARKQHYLTPTAVRLIENLYSSDFEAFGYARRP